MRSSWDSSCLASCRLLPDEWVLGVEAFPDLELWAEDLRNVAIEGSILRAEVETSCCQLLMRASTMSVDFRAFLSEVSENLHRLKDRMRPGQMLRTLSPTHTQLHLDGTFIGSPCSCHLQDFPCFSHSFQEFDSSKPMQKLVLILGLYWGYIGRRENEMETAIRV